MEATQTPPPQLIQLVLQCRARQQLYLVGSTASHYSLLSLVTVEEEQLPGLQDTIDTTLHQNAQPCTVLVMHVNRFNRWMIDGHPFAWTLISKSMLVHDCGYIVDKDIPVTPLYPSADEITRITVFQYRMAKQFFDGAAYYRQRDSTDLAAFMLHQCAEQCLRALLKITTGWHPHTHNLDKLLRYCSITVPQLSQLFSSSSLSCGEGMRVRSEQARLYKLLRNAYVDARYKIYVVMDDDLRKLTTKVATLMKLVRQHVKK